MDTRTIAITGAGSGMGAARQARLTTTGDRVLGIDVRNAEIEADLGTAQGRALSIQRIGELSGGVLDGLVTSAGLNGLPSRPASLLIAVNYFGTVEMLAGLRPLLAAGSSRPRWRSARTRRRVHPGSTKPWSPRVSPATRRPPKPRPARASRSVPIRSPRPHWRGGCGATPSPRSGRAQVSRRRGRAGRGAHAAAAGGSRRPDHRPLITAFRRR